MKTPRSLRRLGSSLLIGGQAITATMRGRINTVDLSDQLMEAGPGSLLIVLIISIAAGSVFNIQVAAELTRQGAGSTVGGILAIGLAREIAPLLTACLLAGKVATAYAAQLGTMKVTEQIDAITMLRTDPVEYLVVPRLIALVVMAPLQCFFFFFVASLPFFASCVVRSAFCVSRSVFCFLCFAFCGWRFAFCFLRLAFCVLRSLVFSPRCLVFSL